jgi:hypothetical protein
MILAATKIRWRTHSTHADAETGLGAMPAAPYAKRRSRIRLLDYSLRVSHQQLIHRVVGSPVDNPVTNLTKPRGMLPLPRNHYDSPSRSRSEADRSIELERNDLLGHPSADRLEELAGDTDDQIGAAKLRSAPHRPQKLTAIRAAQDDIHCSSPFGV